MEVTVCKNNIRIKIGVFIGMWSEEKLHGCWLCIMLLLDIFSELLLPHIRVFPLKNSMCMCKYWEKSKFEKQNNHTSLKKRFAVLNLSSSAGFFVCDIYSQILKNFIILTVWEYMYTHNSRACFHDNKWAFCVLTESLQSGVNTQAEVSSDIKNCSLPDYIFSKFPQSVTNSPFDMKARNKWSLSNEWR